MKILEIISKENIGPAPKDVCRSGTPDDKLPASWLASCRSQGLRARSSSTKKSQKVGNKRISLAGKKLKSTKYGGPISPTRTG